MISGPNSVFKKDEKLEVRWDSLLPQIPTSHTYILKWVPSNSSMNSSNTQIKIINC